MEKQHAKLLAHARRRAHLSQEEAAERIGVQRITVYRWEKGKSSPHPANARRICEVYRIEAHDIGLE